VDYKETLRSPQSKWDKRFASKPLQLSEPEPFLVEHVDYLKPGKILDLACGDGRNAVYLSTKGYKVTAIDNSKVALKRLRQFAKDQKQNIDTHQLDLETNDNLTLTGKFDNIIVIHYKPLDKVLFELPKNLTSKGVLLICTFNYHHAANTDFPEKYCLKKDELISTFIDLTLLKHVSFKDSRGNFDGYIFQNK